MAKHGFVSRVHREKPANRPMPPVTRRANNAKSRIRLRIEHVFPEQKDRMDLFIRTVGLPRARTKIGLANLGRAAAVEQPTRGWRSPNLALEQRGLIRQPPGKGFSAKAA
jgi:hypothetical protein